MLCECQVNDFDDIDDFRGVIGRESKYVGVFLLVSLFDSVNACFVQLHYFP